MLGDASFVAFIPVPDLDVAKDFYVDTLGLTMLSASPFAIVVETGGTAVRLTPVPDFQPQPFTVAGWEVANITKEIDALVAAGVSFRRYEGMDQDAKGINRGGGPFIAAWFKDPAGNIIEVLQER